MIPDLPEGISSEKVLEFYDKLASNLQDQGTIHVNWFTHRRNPSVCWICDLNILNSKILDLCNRFITKSTVDLETELLSENETDTEIDLNVNEEGDQPPEPEYEVEDD